ncbi:MAG: GxxExxY protein, partial [Planctomycetaceae bacterium]|nr:GxxExxY protein [Planctomycetaceae bacterium]
MITNQDPLTQIVIGCAIEVHKQLGPGLFEETYKKCLSYELQFANIKHKLEVELPMNYKGLQIESAYRIDILVENKLILELKSVKEITDIHKAQILTYMRLSKITTGLL